MILYSMMYPALNMQKNKKKHTKILFKTAIGLSMWKRSTVNHLYWSEVSTPNNDGIMIAALILIERALIGVNYSGETMS